MIKSSEELRNNYDAISNLCHTSNEPVYITCNGKNDLVVLSIEIYENLVGRIELYGSLERGIQDINESKTRPISEALKEIKTR